MSVTSCWELAHIITPMKKIGNDNIGEVLGVEEGGTDKLVMGWRVMLGHIVSLVVRAWMPVDKELFFPDTVMHPVEFHINDIEVFLLDLAIGETGGGGVVGLDRGGRL